MKTHLMFSCSDSILLRVRVQMWGFTLWLFCCISPNIYFSHIIQSSSLLPKHLHTFNGGNRKLHYILSFIDCSGMAWRFKIETTGWRVVSGYTSTGYLAISSSGCIHTHTQAHLYTEVSPVKTPLTLEEIRFTFQDNVNISQGQAMAFRSQICVLQRSNSALFIMGSVCPW